MSTFNSLYWDFCSASTLQKLKLEGQNLLFQFPLLGFLLCINHIMLFSVNPPGTFNSLYWDFCSASATNTCLSPLPLAFSFNSLYWDFCSASKSHPTATSTRKVIFQFPLLGFLLCIKRLMFESEELDKFFQFPLLGFLLCIGLHGKA